MTHLTPFSYPQRLSIIATAFLAMILLNSLFQYNYIHHARHTRDMKFWCTTLLIIHCTTWLIYDTVTTINTYYFSNITGMGLISQETSLHVRYFCDGILDLTLMSHTALMFLLISFWHTLFTSETATKFVSKWEFKLYIIYSVISAALYPSLQWSMLPTDDPRLEIIVPQIWYSTELLLADVLFLTVIYRMKKFAGANRASVGKSEGRAMGLVGVLCKLIIALMVWNMIQSFCLLALNIVFISYPTVQEAHAAMTLGVWDLITGLYSICYLSMIITVTLILNVGSIYKLLRRRGGGGGNTDTDSSHSSTNSKPVIMA